MENLIKKRTKSSPKVELNAETGKCLLEGESYLENSLEFYEEIYKWFKEYAKQTYNTIHVIIKIEYMNTSSIKHMFNFILLLKTIEEQGKEIIVEWYYMADDYDLEDDVLDIASETEMEINLIPL